MWILYVTMTSFREALDFDCCECLHVRCGRQSALIISPIWIWRNTYYGLVYVDFNTIKTTWVSLPGSGETSFDNTVVIYVIYLSYEWLPKENLDLFRNLQSKKSSVGVDPWTPWLESGCSEHWAKVWSHPSLLLVLHLKMWHYSSSLLWQRCDIVLREDRLLRKKECDKVVIIYQWEWCL